MKRVKLNIRHLKFEITIQELNNRHNKKDGWISLTPITGKQAAQPA